MDYSQLIKTEAKKLGFLSCGISKAEFLEDEAPRLERWLKDGKHGKMAYMENHFDKRLDPRLLVPDAKSIISLLLNYYSPLDQLDGAPKISKYAYGKDYHIIIKDKLKTLFSQMKKEVGDICLVSFYVISSVSVILYSNHPYVKTEIDIEKNQLLPKE